MLCEECGERESTYTVSVLMGEERTTRHLCPECMARMNAGIAAGNIRNLLSTLMAAIGTAGRQSEEETPEQETNPAEDIICPRCGTALSAFRKSGHLGCAGCYQAFRAQLQPMLEQIHGKAQHAGRRPLRTQQEQQTRSRREQLTRLMAQAVAAEDFETAAQLRDQLRALPPTEALINP